MTHPTTVAVLALAADPGVRRATEIAAQVGVSKQRVDQILRKHNITRFAQDGRSVRCPDCGCRTPRGHRCLLCYTRAADARHAATLITLQCEVCGVQFTRRRSLQAVQLRRCSKHCFCGTVCKSRYLGRTFGWGRHGPARVLALQCEFCHTVYSLPAYEARARAKNGSRRHYCSPPCVSAHRRAGYRWRDQP